MKVKTVSTVSRKILCCATEPQAEKERGNKTVIN